MSIVSDALKSLTAPIEAHFAEAINTQDKEAAEGIHRELAGLTVGFKAKIHETFGPQSLKPLEAQEVMGDGLYFGQEALEETWGIKLAPEQVPAIPFSREDLEGGKRLGQFLELRPKGLTMEEIEQRLAQRFQAEGKGEILYDKDLYQNEAFFTEDKTELKWVLVTKKCIPGSKGRNGVGRTRATADYLINQVFEGRELPPDYAEAVAEFEEQEAELTELATKNWKECNRRLSELKLNRICRRTPAEALFDINHHLDNTGNRVLETEYDCTPRLSSYGLSVSIGIADSAGALVNHWLPFDVYPHYGVVFARSH